MAEVKKVQDGGAPFTNESQIIRVVYDFANDGGATGLLDLLKSDANDDIVIVGGWLNVLTTFTSGGAPTLDAGASTADPNGLLAAVALGSLTAGSLIKFLAATTPLKVPKTETVNMEIKTAAYTAGKAEFVFIIAKF